MRVVDQLLVDDEGRLAALHRLNVLDSAAEQPFEKIVTLVRTVLAVPIATVSLVDRDRQWFKARHGLEATETPRSVSFCTHTIQQREPLIVEDAAADPRFAGSPLVVGPPYIRSYAGVPLRTPEGYNVGSLCAMDTRPRRFSPADIGILSNFANIVCDELQLRLIAQSDHLTGALTRRGFAEQAEREINRSGRYDRPSSLIMLDLDHFKSINDSHGHGVGDDVLRHVAEIIKATIRPSDVLGRLGGEEFGILLTETGAEDARIAAERIRHAIATSPLVVSPALSIPVTASLGVASITEDVSAFADWLKAADELLYSAKHAGRNTVRPL